MTFDLDLWHAGSSSPYIGQIRRSSNSLTFTVTLYKKLSYRRETARRAMLINSCYVSQGMGAIKVTFQSNSSGAIR